MGVNVDDFELNFYLILLHLYIYLLIIACYNLFRIILSPSMSNYVNVFFFHSKRIVCL